MKRTLLISATAEALVSVWFLGSGPSSSAAEPMAHSRSEFNFSVRVRLR
jgi:hypothetical protein